MRLLGDLMIYSSNPSRTNLVHMLVGTDDLISLITIPVPKVKLNTKLRYTD